MYLRYQIKRPYISNRPSTYYGDPVNNAEIMTTRVLCWGAIMFLSQSALSYWTESDSLKWLVTMLAIILIAALIFSQLPLFQGVTEDFKDSIGRLSNQTKTQGRSRGNSALKDIGSSALIEKMLDCKTAVEMWKVQKRLREPMLLDSEKPRWVIKESSKRRSIIRVLLLGLLKVFGVIIFTVLLFALLVILTWRASVHGAGPIVLLIVAIGSGVGMEVYRWKNMVVAGEKVSISAFVRKTSCEVGNGEIDDENDVNVEVNEECGVELEEVSKKKDDGGGDVEGGEKKNGGESERYFSFENPMRSISVE